MVAECVVERLPEFLAASDEEAQATVDVLEDANLLVR